LAARGGLSWPSAGRFVGRGWGEILAADGESLMTVDRRAAARHQPEPSQANTPSVSSNEQMGAAPDHDVFKQGVIRTLH
jgi:hypothetical protein